MDTPVNPPTVEQQATTRAVPLLPDGEIDALIAECSKVPLQPHDYAPNPFLEDVFITVLDRRLRKKIVDNALQHFRTNAPLGLTTLAALVAELGRFPNTD